MSEPNQSADWRKVKDTAVVFGGEGDRTLRPITEPHLVKGMEIARRMYRRSLGVEDDEAGEKKAS